MHGGDSKTLGDANLEPTQNAVPQGFRLPARVSKDSDQP
jgi:hypothetical protein